MKRSNSVDDYIDAAPTDRRAGLVVLRKILKSTELEETVKWGAPCYVLQGKNVVGLGAYRSYVGLWFFQGALLADKKGVLINAQAGKTKAMRQWRFDSEDEMDARRIRAYVREAIALQRKGVEIKPERGKPVVIPDELKRVLRADRTLRDHFKTLTPGKQREYAEHVAEAKREDTRLRRLDKILPMILAGKGLNDKYRS